VSSPSSCCSLVFSTITHLIFLVHLLSQRSFSHGILSHVSPPPWPSSSLLVRSAPPSSPASNWSSQRWTLWIEVNFEDWLGKVGHQEEWLHGRRIWSVQGSNKSDSWPASPNGRTPGSHGRWDEVSNTGNFVDARVFLDYANSCVFWCERVREMMRLFLTPAAYAALTM
jgi:hypothetical protein